MKPIIQFLYDFEKERCNLQLNVQKDLVLALQCRHHILFKALSSATGIPKASAVHLAPEKRSRTL